MKTVVALVLILFCACCGCGTARGQEPKLDFGKWLKFAAGVAAAYGVHEGGHLLAAGATGTDLDSEVGKYNQPLAFKIDTDSEFKGEFVASAGLRAQVISSEIILQVEDIDKNKAFVRGMMAWNVINPVIYALDYWFLHRSNYSDDSGFHGDIQGVEYYKGKGRANVFAASMASLALYQGFRFVKTQRWAPEWIKDHEDDINRLSFTPLPNNTYALTYTIHF